MQHPDRHIRRDGLSRTLAIAAAVGVTAASLIAPGLAHAEPAPAPAPPPAPAEPAAPPPAPADPNAPPAAPADPNAPAAPPPAPREPGRVDNGAGGFSYVLPAGWKISDQAQLSYGQALLTKIPPAGTEQAPSDTSVLLGRLDLKLFAGAEPDNGKAATRLASDMGEFFMPFAGTRVNQQAGPLDAAGSPGAFSSYDVKFKTTEGTPPKPDGQIWAGVVGTTPAAGTPRGQRTPERWFVVWLGTANNPVDKAAATTLAQSIRPYTAPPPPPAPEPGPPDPNAPPTRPGVGVPVPVTNAPPEMLPGG